MSDFRQAAIDAILEDLDFDNVKELRAYVSKNKQDDYFYGGILHAINAVQDLPSAQPERKWTPCSNPPKHHKDVIVRGIEAIGNVTVHKVMQWDVDTWRPTDYAPSIMWKEWSEI